MSTPHHGRKQFSDLSVELQRHIFSYLLPTDHIMAWKPYGRLERTDTVVLRLNRSMHEEALSLLYDQYRIPFEIAIDHMGFEFCGKLYSFDDTFLNGTHPDPLPYAMKKARHVKIMIKFYSFDYENNERRETTQFNQLQQGLRYFGQAVREYCCFRTVAISIVTQLHRSTVEQTAAKLTFYQKRIVDDALRLPKTVEKLSFQHLNLDAGLILPMKVFVPVFGKGDTFLRDGYVHARLQEASDTREEKVKLKGMTPLGQVGVSSNLGIIWWVSGQRVWPG
ncbi:hypothetical protein BT63DRAFT_456302 [Microthyrium microscopicum]|uniref:F-box domain-containing protein n=1 Tax=Microthyrium microscopicum TaxID=703497 RepID=A0A6A6U908_9PEZI|nr:hypothetical protein BT63DRAFT_456302 [Microthyrium microscopicum]